ncbi:MAG TPA: hypothetical protein ENJ16_00960 [Planctomycetaceae bacterium]|nr:hypothetical protein [Planctomycetaceae bacterium]
MMESFFQSMMTMMNASVSWLSIWTVGLPLTTALAAVALIGYLFGRSQIRRAQAERRRDLEQAQELIRQLQVVSQRIRRSLAMQHTSIQQFREKVRALCQMEDEEMRGQIVEEAQRILQPTAELSSDIVHTYEEIRSQASRLNAMKQSRQEAATQTTNG